MYSIRCNPDRQQNIEKIEERALVLKEEVLSINEVGLLFLARAEKERISDEQAIKLLDYLRSFECFQELESYHFWFYDPNHFL